MEISIETRQQPTVHHARNSIRISNERDNPDPNSHRTSCRITTPEYFVVLGLVTVNGKELKMKTLPYHSYEFARKVLKTLKDDWPLAYLVKRKRREKALEF